MTKETFIAKHVDELTGLVLASFSESLNHEADRKGRFMILQMAKVKEILARMYDNSQSPRSLEEVKADAKLLSQEDRVRFRTWIETQPKATSNGVKT